MRFSPFDSCAYICYLCWPSWLPDVLIWYPLSLGTPGGTTVCQFHMQLNTGLIPLFLYLSLNIQPSPSPYTILGVYLFSCRPPQWYYNSLYNSWFRQYDHLFLSFHGKWDSSHPLLSPSHSPHININIYTVILNTLPPQIMLVFPFTFIIIGHWGMLYIHAHFVLTVNGFCVALVYC